jgi:CubicO group peptidase (beta-lactamase class C family)
MAAAPSRLAGLRLVDPDVDGAWTHARVPAVAPDPWPGSSSPLEVDVAGAGRLWTLPQWLEATHGTALLVVVGGRLVHAWYADGVAPGSRLLGASTTKSVLAHLVGRAVADGALALADRVVDHVPELTGTGWAACTVEHVLTMTSGADWVEDHRDATSAASRLVGSFADGLGGSRELLTRVGPGAAPGTRWEYSTADSQVLDWVRERATGTSYPQALGTLWRDLGCTSDALVALDAPDGVAMAGGGLAATAADWARVAALQLHGTTRGGRRLLDEDWVRRSSAPPLPFLRPGRLPSSITTHAGFGLHWWPLDDAGRRVTADGSRGQFAYADRDLDTVVVKTSRWPYDDWLVDRQLRDLSYLGLPEVARAAASTSAGTGAGSTPEQHTEPREDRP